MDDKAGVERRDSSHPSPSSQSQSMETVPQQYHYAASSSQLPARSSTNGQSSMHQTNHLPPIHQSAMQSQPQYAAQAAHYLPANSYAPYQNGALQPAPMPSNVGVNGQNGVMRFPIPQTPLDSRPLLDRRHKKDIKRRTKTGCLTCRKRRIKFKQQSGPAPIAAKPDANSLSPETTVTLPSNPYRPPPSFPGTGGAFVAYSTSLDPALSTGDHPLAMAQANHTSHLQPQRRVVSLIMDDLFSLNDVPPQYHKREVPPPISPAMQQEVSEFYMFHFASGLDRMLETKFYVTHGLDYLHANPSLRDFVAQCAEQLRARTDDANAANRIRSLEARLVWHLAVMPRSSAADRDLVARVDTLENLLTGQFLDPSRIPSPPQPGTEQPNYSELTFWHNLGRLVSIRDDRADPSAMRQINDALGAMRGILGMLENRDVLYSMAVARHIGGRVPEFHPHRHLVASTNDANDELNKLNVAHRFVESEDQRGTSQPIQRICGMALRSWALQKQ
ncbi:hypothetical protein LTR36_000972 [Oleoguttula mirabilis]|uniref:Uncharacterized protein n=1 Tax=Oleoguttula mirabilis TaxID=1507867 RepID=A0AAV9JP22_9PEZI|nr:hypothetical protein LTR36_000972 [Oleoguttula mirabilis]